MSTLKFVFHPVLDSYGYKTSSTDTEMRLASARRTKGEDTTDDDVPSTSGRQFPEATASDPSQSNALKVVLVYMHRFFSFLLVYFCKVIRIDEFLTTKIFAAFWSIPIASL